MKLEIPSSTGVLTARISGGAMGILLSQAGPLLPPPPFSGRLLRFLQRRPQFISSARNLKTPALNLGMTAADLEFPAADPANAGMRGKFDLRLTDH